MAATRKPYESPMVTEVTLAPDEAVLAVCKESGTGNWPSAMVEPHQTCYCPDQLIWCKGQGT